MVNSTHGAAGATAPKTPPHGVNSASELKSTPLAVGSAAVSDHVSTLGVRIHDVRPWITRDVENFRKCDADAMLQELLCGFEERPSSEKSKLLQDSLKAVLDICNNTPEITDNLTEFANCTVEPISYPSFVRAANAALLKLRSLEVSGLPAPPHDETDILFHHNDKDMKQMHQDVKSTRKPDVVLVSREAAKGVAKGGKTKGKSKGKGKEFNTDTAATKPHGNFNWIDVRSTVEFKRSRTLDPPVLPYKVTEYAPPKPGSKYLNLGSGTENPKPTGTSLAPTAAPARSSNKPSNEPRGTRASERLKAKSDNKRKSDQSDPNESASKRFKKTNENNAGQKEPPNEPQKLHPNVQNGMYVAEMFAANIALQCVISYVVNNDIIYIWYFDREDAIQCAGINFIQDLPRFLVLLLAMQRMGDEQWGHNSKFTHVPGVSCDVVIGDVDLKFDLKSDTRTTHFGLRGRATNVFSVQSKYLSDQKKRDICGNDTNELVAKLYWPEERRQSEDEILQNVYAIASKESTVKGHVPDMVWFHRFDETSTAKIRRSLGIQDPDAERGSRVLYIIVFRKLVPITSLSGDEFLSAWWQVVLCHYTLWMHNVHHRDVSPNNVMVYWLNGQWIGVLNDYDLSSINHDGPSGKERTGTVPFMAIDLLEEPGLKGKVTHLYRHDAESLVWVLIWVCLRYEDGKLLSGKKPLDDWLRVDAKGCGEKKSAFIWKFRHGDVDLEEPSPSHQSNWKIAVVCLYTIIHAPRATMGENESILQTWLLNNVKSVAPDIIVRHPVNAS
ncbi:hypothetical protein DFJ58DRAFT_689182 [Suillus subalutaceus]|uniref:uncharacterized protein n=1 Tax=Suillus subalutaceus TaxID=48586 RepID=UPI001B870F5F|nr:uncharacterized protein DFJ58DRAFT_689182 [Suillus subalutaceus]KAG1840485.1 hypothetical protein DFJ58DRAFT_689182 [Suillus subalutaceus]